MNESFCSPGDRCGELGRHLSGLCVVLALILGLFPAAASGSEESVETLWAAHPSKSSYYTEQWSISVWANNGTYVHVQYLLSNIGIGDQSALKIEITEADGKRKSLKKKMKAGITREDEALFLCMGGQCLSARPGAFDLAAQIDDTQVSLHATALAPGFRPGAPLLHDPNGDYDIVLPMPKARFVGQLSQNGRVRPINGLGMVDHSWTTLAPHKLAKRWFRVKTVSASLTCLLTGFARPGSKRDVDVAWLWLSDGISPPFQTRDVTVRFLKTEEDTESKARYLLPNEVLIEAKTPGKHLALHIDNGVRHSRKSILKGLGFFERLVVSSVSEPIDYTYGGEFEFVLHEETPGGPPKERRVSESRDYVLQMINP